MRDLKNSFFAKITQKNAWKLDYIDKLDTISKTSTKQTLNNATHFLDGSVKVFSSRVDDLTDNTNKLLSNSKIEEKNHPKKRQQRAKKKKRKDNFLENECKSVRTLSQFGEYKYKIDILTNASLQDKFLFEVSKGFDNGSVNLFDENKNDLFKECEIDTFDDININNPLTSFNDTESKNLHLIQNTNTNNEQFEGGIELNNSNDNFAIENEIEFEVDNDYISESSSDEKLIDKENKLIEKFTYNPILESNPFAYKNWGGSAFYQLKKHRKQNKKHKKIPNNKKIDFNVTEINYDLILDTVNAFFSEESLQQRSNMVNPLPDDKLITARNLYSFNCIPGYYVKGYEKVYNKNLDVVNMNEEEFTEELNLMDGNNESSNELNNNLLNADDDEIIAPINTEINNSFVESNLDDTLNNNTIDEDAESIKNLSQILFMKYKRSQKKVDMNKLKETLYDSLQAKSGNFSGVMKNLSSYYHKDEYENLSVHYCFISLLHLANEKNIKIISKSDKELDVHL